MTKHASELGLDYDGTNDFTPKFSVRLPQRPRDALHSHNTEDPNAADYASAAFRYDGYSANHPHYHVFRCTGQAPGKRLVGQSNNAPGRQRLCTFRRFCGETRAVWETADKRLALCDHHARKYNRGPCPATRTAFCRNEAMLDRGFTEEMKKGCGTCRALGLEKRRSA